MIVIKSDNKDNALDILLYKNSGGGGGGFITVSTKKIWIIIIVIILEWFLKDHVTLKTASENSAMPFHE